MALCLALMAAHRRRRCGSSWLSTSADELEAEQEKEVALREDYKKKLAQAVNLDALQASSASRCSST